MSPTERLHPKETILKEHKDFEIRPVGDLQAELLHKLGQVYFQTSSPLGLCDSMYDATKKMAAMNPENTHVMLSKNGIIYALIQTLPIQLPSFDYRPRAIPTYRQVEEDSIKTQKKINPNFMLCFSIYSLPGYGVDISAKELQSPALYLLGHLRRTLPKAYRVVAYCPFKEAVGDPLESYLNHQKNSDNRDPLDKYEVEGITTHIIKEVGDFWSNHYFVVIYPKTPEEAKDFNRFKIVRKNIRPDAPRENNVITFEDTLKYFSQPR